MLGPLGGFVSGFTAVRGLVALLVFRPPETWSPWPDEATGSKRRSSARRSNQGGVLRGNLEAS